MHPARPKYGVLKFGGRSVATPDRIRDAAAIIRPEREAAGRTRHVVVVSALGGVTARVVRGPGADHEVTATGVFGDCVRATLSRPSARWTSWFEEPGPTTGAGSPSPARG